MAFLTLPFMCILLMWEFAASQSTFSMRLLENVIVVNTLSNDGCFNKSITSYRSVTTNQRTSTFKLSRGVIVSVDYQGISPLEKGASFLSLKAEFKCCSIFCERFSRQLNGWIWLSGSIHMNIAEEPSAGIYYNKELMCHSDYLDGFFAAVQFTPFELEGKAKECIHRKGIIHYKTYNAVGNVLRITAEFSSSKITVKFAFSLTDWSRNFMMKFMKENEHGTLVNINADIAVREVTPLTYGIETAELCFMALTAFAYSVLFFAVIIVIFMRSKRGFLEKTWVAYEEYKKIKQRQGENAGFSNIALEEI